jgi:hypothetical protein
MKRTALLLSLAFALLASPAAAQIISPSSFENIVVGGRPFTFVIGRDAAGELVVEDHVILSDILVSSVARRTSLGPAPSGPFEASFAAAPNGHVFVTEGTSNTLQLFDLGDPRTSGALTPRLEVTVHTSAPIDPGSVRTGIIAILIGLRSTPVPTISYQAGSTLYFGVVDRGSFRVTAQQPIPRGAHGLIESDGLHYIYSLTSTDVAYCGRVASPAVPCDG